MLLSMEMGEPINEMWNMTHITLKREANDASLKLLKQRNRRYKTTKLNDLNKNI